MEKIITSYIEYNSIPILTTVFYVLAIAAIFLIYLFIELKFLNKYIYKTKNLLRLIPLNILMSLGNIKSLLDLN